MASKKAGGSPADDYPTFDELSDDEKDFLVDQKVVYVPVEDLVPYDRNAKLHDNMTAYLRNMVKRVKFRVPIHLDENRVIISGHARRLVAIELGMKRVPCIFDLDMSPEDVRLQRLADNRLTELSDYDLDMLGIEVVELKDLGIAVEDFGLDFDFGDPLAGWEDEEEEPEPEDDEDIEEREYEPTDDEPFIQPGDIILMGDHRLVCGDATDPEVMRRVLDGETADMCFTSPPYNAGHLTNVRTPKEGAKYVNTEDLRDEGEYEDFIMQVIDNLMANCEEVFINIGLLSGSKSTVVHILNRYLANFKDMVYWKKNNPVPAVKEGVISSSVELIICLGRNGSRQFRHKHDIWYGVIEGSVASNNAYHKVHKATFPLYLPTEMIDVFTEEGDIVMDCFGGTGTTLIACCDSGRRARLVELVPLYCDIIVQRYIEHTGDENVAVIRDNRRLKFPVE